MTRPGRTESESGAERAQGAQRSRSTLREETGRKLIHSAVSVAASAIVYFDPFRQARAIVAAAAATALVVELVRWLSSWGDERFQRAFGTWLRPRERHGITGATTLALGFLAAAYAAPPTLAAAGILMAGIGDAAAAIVGRTVGRHPLPGGKSVEGSLACLTTAYMAAALFPGVTPGMALAGATAATILEAVNIRLDDNLFLPIATTLVLRLTAAPL